MPLFRDRPPLPSDPIYRAILMVLVVSIVAATLVSLVLQESHPDLSRTAGWAALVFVALYLFFRTMGPKWAERSKDRSDKKDL